MHVQNTVTRTTVQNRVFLSTDDRKQSNVAKGRLHQALGSLKILNTKWETFLSRTLFKGSI